MRVDPDARKRAEERSRIPKKGLSGYKGRITDGADVKVEISI